jgi:hypothetical protein
MRAKGIILAVAGVTGVAFGLAWWFRYEPLPPGGYVWDRWTRQMCQSESLSKGQGCNYEIALAEYERKTMECLAMLNAIGAPLRQDAAKLIQAGFSVSPIALLERVVKASSRPGDLILDPFCGCGTAVHAVQNLDRSWIGRTLRGILAKIRPEPVREPLPPPKV